MDTHTCFVEGDVAAAERRFWCKLGKDACTGDSQLRVCSFETVDDHEAQWDQRSKTITREFLESNCQEGWLGLL